MIASQTRSKTARGFRSVALDPDTVHLLRRHRTRQVEERLAWGKAYRDQDLVFAPENGEPIHSDHASKHFAHLVARTNLPRIRLHDLRHTHASVLLWARVQPKVVSDRLGHSSIAVTLDTYSHVLPSTDAEAARAIVTCWPGWSHPAEVAAGTVGSPILACHAEVTYAEEEPQPSDP